MLMIVLGYFASLVMGFLLGLIGGGGSILTVPILVYLFQISPVQATGYSLFIVGLTALVGVVPYVRGGRVDFKTALLFGVPSVLGVYLARAFLLPAIPDSILQWGAWAFTKDLFLMIAFAIMMVFASISMIRDSQKAERKKDQRDAEKADPIVDLKAKMKHNLKSNPNPPEEFLSSPEAPSKLTIRTLLLVGAEGLVVGGVTGLVGAGGGFLIIPALVFLRGLSMRLAVGTSLLIIGLKSLIGFLGDLNHGSANSLDWVFLLTITGLAIGSALIGARVAVRVNEQALKKGFGYFVLGMGSFILIQQLVSSL